jgi:starch synthase
MVASEATPFAKTGGLADVLGALPRALVRQGHEVGVVLPLYASAVRHSEHSERVLVDYPVPMGPRVLRIDMRKVVREGVSYFLVDHPALYNRSGIYGEGGGDYPDNAIRFGLLNHAALAVIRHLFRPNVVHAHDWQTGILGWLLRRKFAGDPTFAGIKVLFTIHNLGYQGWYQRWQLGDLGLDDSYFRPDLTEFFGSVNLLKAGILSAHALSTVSPKYAQEIQTPEYGFGLDGLLRARARDLHGILNGVDYSEWSPAVDPHIPERFDADDLTGKQVCKEGLLDAFGLSHEHRDRPVVGIVSRLADQKGFDLIEQAAWEMVHEDIFLTVLGSGDWRYENLFRAMARARPDRIGVRIAHDNHTAHLIEAGADIFLMPSRYEPCGLNQIYSLRYGTVPVVRATGGLDDTIEEGTGFKFRDYSGSALLSALRQALTAYQDRDGWIEMMRRGMEKDFSWDTSAVAYGDLYERLLG